MKDVEELRQLLEDCELSQRGAARYLGIDERTMRYWCAGKYGPPLMAILALKWLKHEKETGCQE